MNERAKRFLDNVGQAAVLVSRRGVIVEASAEPAEVALVPSNEFEKLLRDVAILRAANQDLLSAKDFRCLRQHRCRA